MSPGMLCLPDRVITRSRSIPKMVPWQSIAFVAVIIDCQRNVPHGEKSNLLKLSAKRFTPVMMVAL